MDSNTKPDARELESIKHTDGATQLTADEAGLEKGNPRTDGEDDPHLAANIENEDGSMTFGTLMSICVSFDPHRPREEATFAN